MSVFKNTLLAAVAVVAISSAASAATITRTYNFGPTATDFTAGPFTVPAFNTLGAPAGSTLNDVMVILSASYTTQGTATNNSTTPQSERLNVSGNVSLTSSNTAINGVTTTVTIPTFIITNAQPGVVNSFGPISSSNTTTATLAPASFLTSSSTFSAMTDTTQSSSGGGGNFANSFMTNASGTVTVNYDYTAPTPPPTGVPEPASLALIGAGLAGLGMLRRRKAV